MLHAALAATLLVLGLAPTLAPPAHAQSLDALTDNLVVQGGGTSDGSPAEPQGEKPSADFDEWEADAKRAEEVLDRALASTSSLEVLRGELAEQRATARAVADKARASLEPLKNEMEALGPAPEEGRTESEQVAAARETLAQRIADVEAKLRQAERAHARAEGLIERIDGLVRQRFAQELLTLGPSPLNPLNWTVALKDLAGLAERIYAETKQALEDPVRSRERRSRLPLVLGAFALGLVLIVWVRGRIVGALYALLEGPGRARQALVAALAALARVVIPAAAAALLIVALRQSALLGDAGEIVVNHLAPGFVALILARAIALAYYAPEVTRLRLSALDDSHATAAARLTLALGATLFLEMVLVRGGEALLLGKETLAVINFGVTLLGAVAMFAMARYVAPSREERQAADDAEGAAADDDDSVGVARRLQTLGAFGLRASAVASVSLSAIGYFVASRYLTVPPIITVGLVGAGMIVYGLVKSGVNALTETGRDGQGLKLVPIFAGFVITCALAPLLALVWGARISDLQEWWGIIAGGLSLGDVRISPVDFLTFALVFGIGYSVTRLLQSVMRTSVLPNTKLDIGGRAAVVSGLGYVGFTLAAVAAITATGLDLSNLAIVAGALSVGIGFGLQNVVNNFVSGIILLVERPIKSGDWIEVGGKHGTVRKIAVRATEIETFDRATLIVPNSELISAQVTNMTHGNTIGRVIVPVGVAYGSDVRKVEKILQEVAEAHPLVLRYPAPFVLFHGFGASSLDFEIRAYLRDVNYVVIAKSQMNFEIDRRFREAGIEIPFAQRDINLRNLDSLRDMVREVLAETSRGAAPAPKRAMTDEDEPVPEASLPGEGIDRPADPDAPGAPQDGDADR